VHDVHSFGSNGVVNGLISHVAAASISSEDSGDAVQALAWHPGGMLLLGSQSGAHQLTRVLNVFSASCSGATV
jgi:hypothetical protein